MTRHRETNGVRPAAAQPERLRCADGIERHREAEALIEAEYGDRAHPKRVLMADFPRGAGLIPNPVNRVAGFFVEHHHFVPGFPDMAWPMIEWVLDTRYPQLAVREHVRARGERDRDPAPEGARTDVVMLEAQLLGIEETADDYLASVEFSGMIREDPSAGPSPFREVWNMTKPKSGTSGWLVAGVQALQ